MTASHLVILVPNAGANLWPNSTHFTMLALPDANASAITLSNADYYIDMCSHAQSMKAMLLQVFELHLQSARFSRNITSSCTSYTWNDEHFSNLHTKPMRAMVLGTTVPNGVRQDGH